MRRPSVRCLPHVVTATYNRLDTDDDGGPRAQAKNQTTRSGLRCFVQPGKSTTLVQTSPEEGLRRITEYNPTTVYFVDTAGLKVDDVLTWVDMAGVTHTYVVRGYYPPCGTSVLWHAVCEERI